MKKYLILGGVKSGKSRRAEQLAQQASELNGENVCYIATAKALDEEMSARIAHHQASRPKHWRTIEEPINLGATLDKLRDQQVVLVDCLTLWLTNLLMQDDEQVLTDQIEEFEAAVERFPHTLILVSNETNMGIMPMDALTRKFCDQAGLLHQRLAKVSSHVELVVAGLPMPLKGA